MSSSTFNSEHFNDDAFSFASDESSYHQSDYSEASSGFEGAEIAEQSSVDEELSALDFALNDNLPLFVFNHSLPDLFKLALADKKYLDAHLWQEVFTQYCQYTDNALYEPQAHLTDDGYFFFVVEQLITQKIILFNELPIELKTNKNVALAAFQLEKKAALKALEKRAVHHFKDLSEALRADKQVALKALEKNAVNFNDLSEALKADKDIILAAMQKDAYIFQYVLYTHKDYYDIAFLLLHQFKPRYLMPYISHEHPRYDELALAAVNQDGLALEGVHRECKNYPNVALTAVHQNACALKHVIQEYKSIDIVLAAITNNKRALEWGHISPELDKSLLASPLGQAFRKAIIGCLTKEGIQLQFVNAILKQDFEVVSAAVNNNVRALQFVPHTCENYPKIALDAVKKNGLALEYIPKNCEDYLQLVLAAIDHNGLALQFVPHTCENYPQIALDAVRKNGLALKFVPRTCKNYSQIVLAAINHNGLALQFVPHTCENYPQIALDAVRKNGLALKFVPRTCENYSQIVLAAINHNGLALQFVPQDYKDVGIVYTAITKSKQALQWVGLFNLNKKMLDAGIDEFFKQAVIECLHDDPNLLHCVPFILKEDLRIKQAAVANFRKEFNPYFENQEDKNLLTTIAINYPWHVLKYRSKNQLFSLEILLIAALNTLNHSIPLMAETVIDEINKQFDGILNIKNYEERKAACAAYFFKTHQLNNINACIEITLERPTLLQLMPDAVFNNHQVIESILNYEGGLVRFLPEHIRSDLRYALMAVNNAPYAIKYLNESIKNHDLIQCLVSLPPDERDAQYQLHIQTLSKKSARKDSYSSNPHSMFSSHPDNDSSNDTDGFIPSI